MLVTMYELGEASKELVRCSISHLSVFGKYELSLYFISGEEQLKFISACIDKHVLIRVKGRNVSILPEDCQPVNFRFDGDLK